ncbi:secretory carrier-associated membrane protein 1-like [Stigmatopora nigra]
MASKDPRRTTMELGLEEYNPFTEATLATMASKPPTAILGLLTQPAVMKPTDETPVYALARAQETSGAASDMLRRQEELERKAAELDRREREMQSVRASGGRRNNWPPLPRKFLLRPCFYHDIAVDIPVEYQKTVNNMYYLWMFHTGTLLANLAGSLAWFGVDPTRSVNLGLAALWFLLFTPGSFVCWYRPIYGAFKNNSSFGFFVFFFVYVWQLAVYAVQSAGIPGWGTCGWLSALECLKTSVAVSAILMTVAALFTTLAVVSLLMFKKVHGEYRTTGASFQKAQQELAADMVADGNTRSASAARGDFRERI